LKKTADLMSRKKSINSTSLNEKEKLKSEKEKQKLEKQLTSSKSKIEMEITTTIHGIMEWKDLHQTYLLKN
jgi:hypothetical protein